MQLDTAAHERGLAEFVARERRERFAAALAKGGKARRKETARLHDRPELDARWVRPAFEPAPGDEHQAAILRAVDGQAPGATYAHVVSGDAALDGLVMELADAVDAAVWATEGSLLSVVPGHVAVYVGELADSARLLIRTTAT